MTFSTFAATKAALVPKLRTALPGVLVSYGWPAGAQAAEWVNVGKAAGDQEAHSINRARLPKDEEYVISCLCSVLRPPTATGQQEANERAEAILDAIDAALRADPHLGGVPGLLHALALGPFDWLELADEQVRETRVLFSVSVKARL